MSATMPSKESTEKPDWCQIHNRWLNMCHYSIGFDNPDFRDEYDKCLAWHDKKIIKALLTKLRNEVEEIKRKHWCGETFYCQACNAVNDVLALIADLEKGGE